MQLEQDGMVRNLYYYIHQRVTTDWTTDPGMAILLTLVTCGIYGYYVFYKLLERRDAHLARMSNVVNQTLPMIRERAGREGRVERVSGELARLELIQREMYEQGRERGAALWLVLGILTGVGLFVGYYFVMTDMVRHDRLESEYFSLMSQALAKLGLASHASSAAPDMPERNFAVYLLLSFVTCGIFSFYWIYSMVDDGNRHVEGQVPWENFIYSALAAA